MESKLNLEEVLSKKSKIKFRMINSNIWYTTIVEKVQLNEITLAFPEMFAAAGIIHGDTIICRFSDGRYEYSYLGDIESIDISFPQVIKARIYEEVERMESVELSGMVDTLFLSNIFVNGELNALHSYVREVGETSITVVCKHTISDGADISVHIVLPLRNIFDSVVKLNGKIVSSKKIGIRNEYRIEITQMVDSDRNRLKQFINCYSA